jgi:hypothetical protein
MTGDVDFLVEAEGADALHEARSAAEYETIHRSHDAASYRGRGQPTSWHASLASARLS